MELRQMTRAFICTCILTAMVILYKVIFSGITSPLSPPSTYRHTYFLVDTPSCKIPDFDPFDNRIRRYIQSWEPLSCTHAPGLTFQEGNTVFINETVVNKLHGGRLWFCRSHTIVRVDGRSDNKNKFLANAVTFKHNYTLSKEFTRIRCYNTSSMLIHENYYAINVRKPAAEQRFHEQFPQHVSENSVKHPYNVMLFGIDSISRLNFQRKLLKTRSFLIDELKAIELKGYNRVGENTYPNLTPLLSGLYVNELPGSRKVFDEYDFIFKQFGKAGYHTLYAEDDPSISTFNYLKRGFLKQPTDYYMRPMSKAMEQRSIRSKKQNCVHERIEQDIYYDYLYRYMEANEAAGHPYFGFTFLSRITHYSMNAATWVDEPLVGFLRRIHDNQLLNNTIMLVFSDHGMRYGGIRNTYIGWITARLPAMYVYLPPTFRRDYPQLYDNVVTNSHRLTTAFDIYSTLRDVLYFNDTVGKPGQVSDRGISLFSEIPASRSCTDASIEQHWCACSQQQQLPTDDVQVIRSAEVLVNHLNELTQKYQSQCETLYVDRITTAFTVTPNEELMSKNRKAYNKRIAVCMYYEIAIMTSPGGALFDATVKHQMADDSMVVSGDVSRTNLYGNTSWCVDDAFLKKICYCKLQR